MGTLLVAPHRFPDLILEEQLACDVDLELVAAADGDEFRAALPSAAIVLLTPYARMDAAAIGAAARCRAIVRYGVGYDNIDVEAATQAGIPAAIVPDASVDEVALHAVALVTALLRRLPAAEAALRRGDWATNTLAGARRLSELTAGVVGLGRIGGRVAAHLAALGARVIAFDPLLREPPPYPLVSLDDLLAASDVVSLHLPLTEATRNVISGERIRSLRAGAILVNVSRGGLVDDAELAAAVTDGRLAGIGLDVFASEPLPLESPLLRAPNTILTPHVAWRSDDSAREYQVKAVALARTALTGERMATALNPEVYPSQEVA